MISSRQGRDRDSDKGDPAQVSLDNNQADTTHASEVMSPSGSAVASAHQGVSPEQSEISTSWQVTNHDELMQAREQPSQPYEQQELQARLGHPNAEPAI